MNTYTHYILARKLAPLLRPDEPGAYLWGAIVPDVRYLAGLPRRQTHLPRREIRAWLDDYPHHRSFVRGYQVHCLLDEIDLARVLGRAFPLNLVGLARRRTFSPQQMGVLVELYYLQTSLPFEPFSGEHNPILDGLGIHPEHSAALADALRGYLARPSFQTALSAFQDMGLLSDTRIDRYVRAAQSLEKNWALRSLLLLGVRNSHLERKAMDFVSRAIEMGSR